MMIMGHSVEHAVVSFQHDSHRGRQSAPHTHSKALLDGCEVRCHQNADTSLWEQVQMGLFRDHVMMFSPVIASESFF